MMQLRLNLDCEVIPIKDYTTPELMRHIRVGLAKKRRRYYLHTAIRKYGVAVKSRQREIQITMEQYDSLPDNAKKLVLELVGTFGYNAQIGIPE